jgi:coenzyme F420-0:L-glutamate ligase/coenzyme F420-1:gamma-L-glutamate ligase
MTLTLTPLLNMPLIRPSDDLADIIFTALQPSDIELQDGDILILASKIVSKAEGRQVNLATIIPTKKATELATRCAKDPRECELVLSESHEILRVRTGTIIVEHRLGFVCANAGIDHSNVAGEGKEWVLLLPKDPDRSSAEIRRRMEAASGKRLGVMIVDSHGRAWRLGVVGMCIGLSGLPGLVDERGWKDLFGYTLQITVVGAADELAAAASLVMGQAAEGTPVVHVRGFPYPLGEGSLKELLRPRKQDLFR